MKWKRNFVMFAAIVTVAWLAAIGAGFIIVEVIEHATGSAIHV
jgi:hypothetical protein